jgi:hypothetical protein
MTLLNPAYAIIVPFLLIFTLPLAIFATITTTLAFSILLFRVILVYIELGLSIIPYYLLGRTTSPKPTLQPIKSSPTPIPTPRRRKRRSSAGSNVSGGTSTPVAGDVGLGLSKSVGPTRDFEGVGGWRLGDASDDDILWDNINTRLELPAHHERRHQRSLTGEWKSKSFNTEMMNTARPRTPTKYEIVFPGDGYLPQVPTSPKLKRSASGITGASNSSGSSKSSSVLGMKQR